MFLRSRSESGASCECSELQYASEPSSLCECSFRDAYQEFGGLYGGSSCCSDSDGGSAPALCDYGQHRCDYSYNWDQSYEVPVPYRTNVHGLCDDSMDYTNNDECQEGLGAAEGAETIEMEVNEGFRRFLEQSKRYREERDKSRQANEESSEEDYVEVGTVPVVATSHPPLEQQGFARKKAMKDLYGRQSEHIMSLETSLQLNYDRNCDVRRPIFWPSIPLKF